MQPESVSSVIEMLSEKGKVLLIVPILLQIQCIVLKNFQIDNYIQIRSASIPKKFTEKRLLIKRN
jgi:hypothetical protein